MSRALYQSVLALAQQQIGHSDDAQAALAEASQLIARLKEAPGQRIHHDLLIAEILYRKAECKINGKKEPQRPAEPDTTPMDDDDDR